MIQYSLVYMIIFGTEGGGQNLHNIAFHFPTNLRFLEEREDYNVYICIFEFQNCHEFLTLVFFFLTFNFFYFFHVQSFFFTFILLFLSFSFVHFFLVIFFIIGPFFFFFYHSAFPINLFIYLFILRKFIFYHFIFFFEGNIQAIYGNKKVGYRVKSASHTSAMRVLKDINVNWF